MFSMPFEVRSVRISKLDTAGNEMREMMSCTKIKRWFPTAMRISLTRVVTDLGLSSVKLLSVFVDWDSFPQKVRSFCTLSLKFFKAMTAAGSGSFRGTFDAGSTIPWTPVVQ